MTRRLAPVLLALLVLAGIAACGGSNVAIPEATTPTETASRIETATTTSTKGSGDTENVLPEAVLSEPDAPVEILPGVELGSLCSEFSLGSELPGDLNTYNDMITARGDWAVENYIRWSPDGSQILFDVSESRSKGPVDLYAVAADGSRLEKIVDASSREPLWGTGGSMMSFDVSPDGSRIAYSACTYNRKPAEDSREDDWVYNYDIALANIDGTDVRRLTATSGFENFPVWSPDGSRIAYFSSHADFRGDIVGRYFRDPRPITGWITIYNLETGEFSYIVPSEGNGIMSHPPAWSPSLGRNAPKEGAIIPLPPVWSPDGQKLAFIVYEGAVEVEEVDRFAPAGLLLKASVYAVGVDGTGLTRITEAASSPAWSPDGKRIAVAVPAKRGKADLYTFAADGSDPVLVKDTLSATWNFPVNPWMGSLSWSPDGSQILFEQRARRINLDASQAVPNTLRYATEKYPRVPPMLATWSPDGTRLAVRTEDGSDALVYVIGRDGSNPRYLVETNTTRSATEDKIKLAQ